MYLVEGIPFQSSEVILHYSFFQKSDVNSSHFKVIQSNMSTCLVLIYHIRIYITFKVYNAKFKRFWLLY